VSLRKVLLTSTVEYHAASDVKAIYSRINLMYTVRIILAKNSAYIVPLHLTVSCVKLLLRVSYMTIIYIPSFALP
jgi:hypothetical protein